MNRFSRRDLLKGSLAFCVPALFPVQVFGRQDKTDGGRPLVVEVRGSPEAALEPLLRELGGIERFVKKGSTVLLKPNMSFPNPPEMATTTDPRLVRAVATKCLEAGARRVFVADHPMRSVPLCLDRTGMREACAGLKDVHLLGASEEGMFEPVRLSGTRELKEVRVLRALLQSDLLINLPRMKSHGATTVSLGTKGNMGLIWDRKSFHGRMDLDQAIGDLNTFIRAALTILDGSRVLTAGGPLGPGPVEDLGCLIGGTDPVAVDAVGVHRAKWYGRVFSPAEVGHLAACHERGLGEIDLDRIDLVSREVPPS